ncbi:MAG: class 1 fructose-bisphosphatase, partial [Mesorhizobium sp.]
MPAATLDAFLNSYLGPSDELRSAVVATVRQLTQAATKVRNTINQGVLGTAFAGTRSANADGDIQKDLDIFADDIFLDAMRHAPVALYASEELEQPVLLDSQA